MQTKDQGPRTRDRSGFTLIELLVVISIILILGAIAVRVMVRNTDKQRALEGADRTSGWLLMAKQWALRDQAPRGLRLVIDNNPNSPTYWMMVKRDPLPGDTQLMQGVLFIEQPDPWVQPGDPASGIPAAVLNYTNGDNRVTTGNGWVMNPMPAGSPRNFQTLPGNRALADFSGGFGDSIWKPTWPITPAANIGAPGDWLEMDSGANAKLAQIVTPTGADFPGPNPLPPSAVYTSSTPLPPAAIYARPASGYGSPYADGVTRYELFVHPRTHPTWSGTNWRILRQPRPRPGESPLAMPRDVVIDLSCNHFVNPSVAGQFAYGWEPRRSAPFSPAAPTVPPPFIDIMFTPAGAVLGSFTTDIKLWVRDVTAIQPQPGNPYLYGGEFYLVTVNLRTGLISVHPGDRLLDLTTTPNIYKQPYSFTQDGRSSGL